MEETFEKSRRHQISVDADAASAASLLESDAVDTDDAVDVPGIAALCRRLSLQTEQHRNNCDRFTNQLENALKTCTTAPTTPTILTATPPTHRSTTPTTPVVVAGDLDASLAILQRSVQTARLENSKFENYLKRVLND